MEKRIPPNYSSIASRIGELQVNSGARLTAVQYTQNPPGADLTEISMDAGISGGYPQIMRFVNSLERDHGIETPEVRAARNKPAEGCLTMRAYPRRRPGQHRDLRRRRRNRLRAGEAQRPLQRGLISPEQASRMSDHEALQLIFLPGFSTAEKVTNVSGRGVGLDVVKTNIEKIGGTVDLQSQPGEGTTIKIKIPLTLAIIPALIVTSGGERFAIPQVSLLELVRLEADQARQQIEFIHGAPVYRLRGQLLPLAYLNRELKLGESPTPTRPPSTSSSCRPTAIRSGSWSTRSTTPRRSSSSRSASS